MKSLTLALTAALTLPLHAQTTAAPTTPAQTPSDSRKFSHPDPSTFTIQTFYLTSATQGFAGNEVTTALRNMLDPSVRIYLVPSQNAIVIAAPPEQLQLAHRLLTELDRPGKIYRLTYTINTSDDGKRTGSQSYTMIVASGQRTDLKQGSRVPVLTGSYNADKSTQNSQITYLDIGMNFQATVDEIPNGIRLHTKVEQTSVADEKSSLDRDPVLRQATIEGTSLLTAGKPLNLGAIDIQGSTRHIDVEARVEPIR